MEIDLAFAVQRLALLGLLSGIAGAITWQLIWGALEWAFELLERHQSRACRISDARWRSHWDRAMREAHEAGYTGRRAIAYAMNVMKSRRQAIRELEAL